jgi:hypothetical protein
VLVLLEVLTLDEAQVAAIVVAVNTVVGFGVRLVVVPSPVTPRVRRRRRSAAQGLTP